MQMAPDVKLHIVSSPLLENKVKETLKQAQEKKLKKISQIQQLLDGKQQESLFHSIKGLLQFEAALCPEIGVQEAYDLTPSLVNFVRNMLIIPGIIMP